MNKIKLLLISLLAASMPLMASVRDTVKDNDTDMGWFNDAKFGIFIHWGVYAVNGQGESWPMFNDKISREDYLRQCDEFTAVNYDPKAWASLFKEAGAKYVVLTTKHHDGVALWDTKANDLSAVKATPAKRDLLVPFTEAVREKDMKVGFYFSWLDWSNDDYGTLGRMNHKEKSKKKPISPEAWQRFRDFNDTQLKELSLLKPDLFWFDGDWGIAEEYWEMEKMRKKLKAWAPGVVLNARMGAFGDYDTPEQGIPFNKLDGPWELCMTMCPGWGYMPQFDKYAHLQIKANELIQLLSETSSMGGNLLLNVSPKPDGSIPEWQQKNLKEIGAWLKVNGEAIYGSTAGIHRNHYAGCSTLSKDGKTLYLFTFGKPLNGLMVKGLRNKPKSITVLGDTRQLKMKNAGGAPWHNVPPTRFIYLPDDIDMGYGRIVKIELNEKLDLYKGKSGAIEQN